MSHKIYASQNIINQRINRYLLFYKGANFNQQIRLHLIYYYIRYPKLIAL